MPYDDSPDAAAFPAGTDAAVVTALYLNPFGPDMDEVRAAVASNPLLGEASSTDLDAVVMLHKAAALLREFQLLAAEQLAGLLGRYSDDPQEAIEAIAARMSEADRRRWTMLAYAVSMGSPFQAGPPDSVAPYLVDHIEVQ